MLSRDGYGRHRPIIVRCDGKNCLVQINTPHPELEEAKRFAHRAGWLMRFQNGVYTNVCPKCRKKEMPK